MSLLVLFVHSDPAVRAAAEERLAREGHDVLAVDSGERAIDQFVQTARHAMVVDLELPGRDGAATIESIRWAPGGKDTFIVLTGEDAQQVERVARRLGVEFVPHGDLDEIAGALRSHVPPKPSEEVTRPFPLPIAAEDPSGNPLEAPGANEARDVARRAEAVERDARIEGELGDVPFGTVLTRLAEQRVSGALLMHSEDDDRETVTGDALKKVVFFRNGLPIHARSNLEEECLGQVLLRRGAIDQATLDASITRVLAGDGKQGGILVAMGAITPQQLRDALEFEQEQKLLELFGWESGSFRFSDTMSPPQETVTLERSLAELVLRGIRERMNPGRLLTRLAESLEAYVVPSGGHFHGLRRCLDEPGRALLVGFDGAATVRTILDAGQPSRLEAARILFAAHCLGAVSFRDEPAVSRPEGESPERETSEVALIRSEVYRLADRLRDGQYAEALDVRPGDGLGAAQAVARLESRLRAAMEGRILPAEAHSTALEVLARLPRAALAVGGDYQGSSMPPASDAEWSLPRIAPRLPGNPRLPSLANVETRGSDAEMEDERSAERESPEAETPRGASSTVPPPRRKMTSSLELPVSEPAEDRVDLEERAQRMLQAERFFRRGRRSLSRDDAEGALASLARAVALAPEEGEFLVFLGWARHQASSKPAEREQALEELRLAVTLVPKMHDAQLFYARALRDAGEVADARNAYARALAANPDSRDALDELRLLH